MQPSSSKLSVVQWNSVGTLDFLFIYFHLFMCCVKFKEGLMALGVLEEITSHLQAFESVFFQDTTSLKAGDIVGLFQAKCTSIPWSKQRRLEARTIAFWKDWLLEVEGMGPCARCYKMSVYSINYMGYVLLFFCFFYNPQLAVIHYFVNPLAISFLFSIYTKVDMPAE